MQAIRENTKRHNAISNNERRDNAMAMLFFIIIACFLLCHSGKFVLNFFEVWQTFSDQADNDWPLWAFVLTRINHFLLIFNSSTNFFIYCFRDSKFRNAAFSILGLSRFLSSDSTANNNNTNHTEAIELTTAVTVNRRRSSALAKSTALERVNLVNGRAAEM